MTPRYLSVFMLLGGGLLFLALWAASVGFVYWDVYRRGLPWRQQIGWIAAVTLLPLLGFFTYLFARFVLPAFAGRRPPGAALKKRETLPLRLHPRQVYLPTLPVEAGSEPAAGPRREPPAAGAGAPPRGAFALVSGPGAGQEFPLLALPAAIGRGPQAAIRLDADHSVSRRHAEVYERAGALYLRDLDSTHGTQVNGVWIADQRLEPGDEVQIGSSLLVFRLTESP